MTRALFALVLIGLIAGQLVITTGCGREDDTPVIVESPEPDFSASPNQVIITAKNGGSPRPAASTASAKASAAAPGDGLVPFLTVITPLNTTSGQFQPLVKIELHAGGVKQVEDNASPDGAGATGKFRKVKPGKYLMRVISDLMPEQPLEERQVDVQGSLTETITMGAVSIGIPHDREEDVMKAIQIGIVSEPSRKPMVRGLLKDLVAHGVVGEKHDRTVLLPFGHYSYSLACVGTDPTVGFVGVPEGATPVISANTFELSEAHPVSLVNLESVIRTKAQ